MGTPVPAVAVREHASFSLLSIVLPYAGSPAADDTLQAEGEALVELGERLPGLVVLCPWPAAARIRNGG